MTTTTNPQHRLTVGRITRGGRWVIVVREPNGNGIKLEFPRSVRPYGKPQGAA